MATVRSTARPEYSTDHLPVLDPKSAKVTYITPPEGADVPEALGPGHAAIEKPMAPSAYWGMEQVWDTKFDNHNSTCSTARAGCG